MRLGLREYQQAAVVRLLRVLQQARNGVITVGSPQGIQFSAPTGSGKTVVLAAVIEALLAGNEYSAIAGCPPDPELVFLWLSDLPELNRQSLERIQTTANGLVPGQLVEIDQDFDRSELERGKAYFLNYQKLRSGSLLTRLGDQRTSTIWETIAVTQQARPGKLIAIIDEAHRGLLNTRGVQTIASKFIAGAQKTDGSPPEPLVRIDGNVPQPFPPLDLVVGVSATPKRFETYLTTASGRALLPVIVQPAEVRGSGLIKDRLVLHGPQEGDFPWTLLGRAIDRVLDFERDWQTYAHENQVEPVIPALLVQVQDGSGRQISTTDLQVVISLLREKWPELRSHQVVHCFNGVAMLEVDGWPISYREPNTIADDEIVRAVLFKTALNTGWDCPRAEVLMSFRTMQDRTAIAQLVGRMVRTPLGRRVAGDGPLNSTHLFLPFFDRSELESVRAELTSDVGEGTTDIEDADEVQELTVRRGGDALFERLKILPTEVVPPAKPIPDLRRLLRTARLLEQHGLAEGAVRDVLGQLTTVLLEEFQRKARDPSFEQNVQRRAQYVLSSLSIEDGLVVAEEARGEELAAADVEESFQATAFILSEELALKWLRERFDTENPLRAKLEFMELVSSPALIAKLQQRAKSILASLDHQFKREIVALPSAQADEFAVLQRAGREVQSAIMTPERRVVFPVRPDAEPTSGHLFVLPGSDDECLLTLTGWEKEALQLEKSRPDFLAFLRNLDRKPWALSYAYQYDGIRAGYPDFLIFRSAGDDVIVDIIEPHLDAGDSVAKAKGMARFARVHRDAFGRVEMLRKFAGTSGLFHLPLHDPKVADAILAKIESAEQLNIAFKELGYIADPNSAS